MLRGFFPPVRDWHPGAMQRALRVLLLWLGSAILPAAVCIKPGCISVSNKSFENTCRDTWTQERKQVKKLERWNRKE